MGSIRRRQSDAGCTGSIGSEPVFNDVYVPSAPVPVNAGDSLGHMGFISYRENGKRSRYQVHIECLSMDDMEKFITNPGRAGEDAPVYLSWKADAPLSDKSDTGITAGSRKQRLRDPDACKSTRR
jgi:hypothetical protein